MDPGFVNLMRAEFAQGCFGEKSQRTFATPWGVRDWHQTFPRLIYWIPRIAHWRFMSGDYSDIQNQEATWFIDPPYNNPAGAIYRTNDVIYAQLGEWCRSRQGQVIVCENRGATWLPFKFLTKRSGSFTGRDEQTKADGGEVIYTQGTKDPWEFDFDD